MAVYKNYDQAGLDRQYNNRGLVPDFESHVNYWDQSSKETELKYPVIQDLVYGDLAVESLDIYPSTKSNSPVMIFIHGGYWQMMNKSNFQFVARAFQPNNITSVIITYPLAPTVTMGAIVGSCRKAIHWIYRNISTYQGDPDSVFISGHSAGGHLATMMMTQEYGPRDIPIKGVCALSGLYNLIPIQLSFVNQALQMDTELAASLSPVFLTPMNSIPLLLAVGEKESDEYHAQLNELYDSWSPRVKSIERISSSGLNHFTIINEFGDPESTLSQQVINWMNKEVVNWMNQGK